MLGDFGFERLEGGVLQLRAKPDASPGHAYTMKRPDALAELASRAFGRRIELRFTSPTTAAAAVEQSPETAEVADHPLVREAMELFDAHVVQVRPAAGRPPTPTRGDDSPKDSD